jgi:hypothetical protein
MTSRVAHSNGVHASRILHNPKEAAAQIMHTPGYLAVLRCQGKGPAYTKILGKIYYDQRDLDDFLDSQRVVPGEPKPRRRGRPRKQTSSAGG